MKFCFSYSNSISLKKNLNFIYGVIFRTILRSGISSFNLTARRINLYSALSSSSCPPSIRLFTPTESHRGTLKHTRSVSPPEYLGAAYIYVNKFREKLRPNDQNRVRAKSLRILFPSPFLVLPSSVFRLSRSRLSQRRRSNYTPARDWLIIIKE